MICFLVVGAVFVLLTAWSWRRWPDLLVDFGHELYIPWQITCGRHLYTDIAFAMGPFSQYFNAGLFRIFGVSLSTLIAANLAILVGIVVVTDRILRRICAPGISAFACVLLLTIFGFSQYSGVANYNYVTPYRHEMTHGILFILLMVYAFVLRVESGSRIALATAGACCGFAFLTKSEIFLPCAAAAVVALTFVRLQRSNAVHVWGGRDVAVFACGCLLPPLAAVLLLQFHMPAPAAIRGVLANTLLVGERSTALSYPFYRANMGLDDIGGNVLVMLAATAAVAAGAVVLAWCARIVHTRFARGCISQVVIGLAAAAVGTYVMTFRAWAVLARALPVLVVICGVVAAAFTLRHRRDRDRFNRGFVICLWSVVSMLLLAKMVLNVRLDHYGFVLAMPAMILVVVVGVTLLPAWLGDAGDMFRVATIGLCIAAAGAHLTRAQSFYSHKDLVVGEGGDRFVTFNGASSARSLLVVEALKFLRATMPEEATLLVLPEGVTFNYVLRRSNPTPYHLLTPWEMNVFGGEQKILQAIRRRPPDFVAILNINMRDHGRSFFGESGYGDMITTWIDENYRNIKRLNLAPYKPENFRIEIYQRGLDETIVP